MRLYTIIKPNIDYRVCRHTYLMSKQFEWTGDVYRPIKHDRETKWEKVEKLHKIAVDRQN